MPIVKKKNQNNCFTNGNNTKNIINNTIYKCNLNFKIVTVINQPTIRYVRYVIFVMLSQDIRYFHNEASIRQI